MSTIYLAKNMDMFEEFAVGQFLSDYPLDKTYDEIYQLILDEDESITVWEPFEHCFPQYVTECIDNLLMSLRRDFVSKQAIKDLIEPDTTPNPESVSDGEVLDMIYDLTK